MKQLIFSALIFISFAGHTQSRLEEFFATTSANESAIANAHDKVEAFIQPLAASNSSDQKLLRSAFHKMHSTFLRKYEAYADFNKVFESGTYDCLTATALFSQILDRLNFSYEVIETNYHIFIMVQTNSGEVLLETTDRWGGFINDKETILKRAGDYRANQLEASEASKKYQYSFKLYQPISPQKLNGLLYFNQAVKAYNSREWTNCASLLEKSYALYESPRCVELGSLLINTVNENSTNQNVKDVCLSRLKNIWIKKSESIASYE